VRRNPLQIVIAQRRKLVEKLKADRAKVEAQMKEKLAEYDGLIQPEETFLRELEKMAAGGATAPVAVVEEPEAKRK
jgi:hypothetical protein